MNEYAPQVFGQHLVVVRRYRGNYRIPVDFAVVGSKDQPYYRSENLLFRPWAVMRVVVAEAVLAANVTLRLFQRRGDASWRSSA